MSQLNSQDSNNEFNSFNVEEIIVNKESSHETGEYNEIKISTGLISKTEEESSSSEQEDNTTKALTISTTASMAIGVIGIVVGTIVTISPSINFLNENSLIGISQAQCFFELGNINHDNVEILLQDGDGNTVQTASLFPTDVNQQYVAEFYDLTPGSTYYLQGINNDGKEIKLGNDNSFTTLNIPSYDIAIDRSEYDKNNGKYDLTFSIENPNKYHIDALLICENDKTLNTHQLSIDGIYHFTLPNILSSYRLELYQEDYLVGQTTFSDYQGIEMIDETLEIGIASIYMGLSYGEIDPSTINVSLIKSDDQEEVSGVEIGPDGYAIYVTCYQLEANTDYILRIYDNSRPTFTYFSYQFSTIPIPQYEITIDDSNFDIANNNYTLTFTINNLNNYLVDAYLHCINDTTLDDSFIFTDDSLTVTLPSLYSEYRLDLNQDGYDVGSITFSYYTPMQIVTNTLNIDSTTFGAEIDLGDVPISELSAYLRPVDMVGDELELEILPIENTNRISLRMEGLISNTKYVLEIRDSSRQTFIYLNYEFNTLT